MKERLAIDQVKKIAYWLYVVCIAAILVAITSLLIDVIHLREQVEENAKFERIRIDQNQERIIVLEKKLEENKP